MAVGDDMDVRALLQMEGPSVDPTTVSALDAGFFHRTLARWAGLESSESVAGLTWSYPIWRADLELTTTADDGLRAEYQAVLYRTSPAGATDDTEVVRYALLRDRPWQGDEPSRILAATWLSAPPSFVGDIEPSPANHDSMLQRAALLAAELDDELDAH
jgi:hypothetical protein